jgi:hypothetical protein
MLDIAALLLPIPVRRATAPPRRGNDAGVNAAREPR